MMLPEGLTRLGSGGIMANYRCSAACGHCLYCSSPKRENGYITRERAANICALLRGMGCRSLHIGGGEPFLNRSGLLALVEEIAKAGIGVDYVETNASWVRGDSSDTRFLRELHAAGMEALMVSICPYHNEYIPLSRPLRAIEACREAGVPLFVWQTQFIPKVRATGDINSVHSLEDYAHAHGSGAVKSLPREFGLRMLGRAAITHRPQGGVPTEKLLAQSGGCDGPLDAGHYHIDHFGDYIPGGCTGLAVELGKLSRIPWDEHPAASLIWESGAAGMARAAIKSGFKPDESYESACALCQHARTFLALRRGGDWPDLRPLGFYEELSNTLL